MSYLLVAQAVAQVDPNLGASITSMVGSLGSAGAAVAMAIYFLSYLRDRDKGISDWQGESQRKFQDQLDRLGNQNQESQRAFQEQIKLIASNQNEVLARVTQSQMALSESMKSLEKSLLTIQHRIDLREARGHKSNDPDK